MLVLASDRGLCGAYNGNVLRTAMSFIRDLQDRGIDVDVQTAGKKAVGFFRFQKVAIDERHQFGDTPTYEQIERLARSYIDAFTAGKYDAINIKLDKTGGLTEALRLKRQAVAAGFEIMVGCMLGTSLSMAPAQLLAQDVRYVDLDGPLLLARDRDGAIRYEGSLMAPASSSFWG